jgi:hypothetical protein
MSDTHITFQKINNNDIIFFVGNNPTVTFSDNVTVFIYPRINYYVDTSENKTIDTRNETNCNKILTFFKNMFNDNNIYKK